MTRHLRPFLLITIPLLGIWAGSLFIPDISFRQDHSTTVYDRTGLLLSARTSKDGQWHFPRKKPTPERYAIALLTYEDRRFYYHPGVDPIAIARAIWQNVRRGEIVSGGSTLTMQLARMSRERKGRDWSSKLLESFMALKHELIFPKLEILDHYVSQAPFGGNVIGLEAATWRYFGKDPSHLTWAEAATLAVLPNAPGLIHPGKNRLKLLKKRDQLLRTLAEKGFLSNNELELAMDEAIPDVPFAIPNEAPHLTETLRHIQGSAGYQTSLQGEMQKSVNQLIQRYYQALRQKEIHNAAVLVIDHIEEEVIVYAGNIPGLSKQHAPFVDLIQAPRSTGSILKPFLVMDALSSGSYTPKSWEKDIPCWIRGYHPENFHKDHDGLVSIEQSLIRSLNVPMVFILQRIGIERLLIHLRDLGFRHMSRPASHYGLSLITGGAEATLWEVTHAYAAVARISQQLETVQQAKVLTAQETKEAVSMSKKVSPSWIDPGSAHSTLTMMQRLERPGIANQWQSFEGAPLLSWKTGTSYGFRDAWAVGSNRQYTIGVWVGNADGEGRPGIIGVSAAAPILLDLFRMFPANSAQPDPPYDHLDFLPVCRLSGYLPSECCPVDTILAPVSCFKAPVCTYHKKWWVDKTNGKRALQDCAIELADTCVLILPPAENKYFRAKHPEFQSPPPWSEHCQAIRESMMEWIYPRPSSSLFITKNEGAESRSAVFELAHRSPENTVYWYMDGEFLGQTTGRHEMPVSGSRGDHTVTAIDDEGNEISLPFYIQTGDR